MAVKAPLRTLRLLMAERGIEKYRDLAAAAGLASSTITRIAKHGNAPSDDVAARLAKALGVKPADIHEAARAQREATS